jgi:hypothetical protein
MPFCLGGLGKSLGFIPDHLSIMNLQLNDNKIASNSILGFFSSPHPILKDHEMQKRFWKM